MSKKTVHRRGVLVHKNASAKNGIQDFVRNTIKLLEEGYLLTGSKVTPVASFGYWVHFSYELHASAVGKSKTFFVMARDVVDFEHHVKQLIRHYPIQVYHQSICLPAPSGRVHSLVQITPVEYLTEVP